MYGEPDGVEAQTSLFNNERILYLASGHLPAGRSLDTILFVRGNFSCGSNCRFGKPIYVGGDCEIGKESQLEAITAEGSLRLCPSVKVRRWADSDGAMDVRAGCRIGSIAISSTTIRLSVDAEISNLQAPGISSESDLGCEIEPLESSPTGVLEIRPPGNREYRPAIQRWGLDPSKLHPLGADTWIYDGSFSLTAPIILQAHLVTERAFSCPAGSLLEADVKSGGELSVGSRSVCKGVLTAAGDLVMGPGSVFQNHISSKQMVLLATGVHGLRADGPVDVHAGGNLLMEGDVLVRGRLQSNSQVITVRREVAGLLAARLQA